MIHESSTCSTLHDLRLANREHLMDVLFNKKFAAIIYDIDGTIRANGITDPSILSYQASMIRDGMVGAGCSSRGEDGYFILADPLKPYLINAGVIPEKADFYFIGRYGATTEQPYADNGRGVLLDGHPIDEDLYNDILTHPLVAALESLSPVWYADEHAKTYQQVYDHWGVEPDPRCKIHPKIYHDRHRTNGRCYKLTIFFSHKVLRSAAVSNDSQTINAARRINDFINGINTERPGEVARRIQEVLERDGVPITASTNIPVEYPEIEITAAEISKRTGYNVIRSVTGNRFTIPSDDIDKHIVTVGDSPDEGYNDADFLQCGTGVTNVNYYNPDGMPYVLDVDGDKIQRSRFLFSHVQPLKRYR